MNIVVVGLGKIGSSIFATLGEKFDVIGVDTNDDIVKIINMGEAPFNEPGLEEAIKKHKLMATTNTHQAVQDSDCAFVMMPTPSKPDGVFDTSFLEMAIAEIGRSIPDDKEYYFVVVCSTTIPGTMKTKIAPLLERTSNRKLGKNLGLVYMPEMNTALGNVMHGIKYPDYMVVGCSDDKVLDIIDRMLVTPNGLNIRPWLIHYMNFNCAELTKVASNAFSCMKMSFANSIAQICEYMPDGNAHEVLKALGKNPRIGGSYLKAGLPYGGTCFPRDDKAFHAITRNYCLYEGDDSLALASRRINQYHQYFIVDKIRHILADNDTNELTILGLTYKPDIYWDAGKIESPSIEIMKMLMEHNIEVNSWDPSLKMTPTIADKIGKVIFIATPWDEFKDWKFKDDTVVIDAFGILKKTDNIKYIRLGDYPL